MDAEPTGPTPTTFVGASLRSLGESCGFSGGGARLDTGPPRSGDDPTFSAPSRQNADRVVDGPQDISRGATCEPLLDEVGSDALLHRGARLVEAL